MNEKMRTFGQQLVQTSLSAREFAQQQQQRFSVIGMTSSSELARRELSWLSSRIVPLLVIIIIIIISPFLSRCRVPSRLGVHRPSRNLQ